MNKKFILTVLFVIMPVMSIKASAVKNTILACWNAINIHNQTDQYRKEVACVYPELAEQIAQDAAQRTKLKHTITKMGTFAISAACVDCLSVAHASTAYALALACDDKNKTEGLFTMFFNQKYSKFHLDRKSMIQNNSNQENTSKNAQVYVE